MRRAPVAVVWAAIRPRSCTLLLSGAAFVASVRLSILYRMNPQQSLPNFSPCFIANPSHIPESATRLRLAWETPRPRTLDPSSKRFINRSPTTTPQQLAPVRLGHSERRPQLRPRGHWCGLLATAKDEIFEPGPLLTAAPTLPAQTDVVDRGSRFNPQARSCIRNLSIPKRSPHRHFFTPHLVDARTIFA